MRERLGDRCVVGKDTALTARELRADPVGAVLRADDPLAHRDHLKLADLAGRRWFQFPDGTDPIWQAYWNGGEPREGPVVRVVQECVQAVLWNGTVGITPLGHKMPDGLATVPLVEMEPSNVVVVWNEGDTNPNAARLYYQRAQEPRRPNPPKTNSSPQRGKAAISPLSRRMCAPRSRVRFGCSTGAWTRRLRCCRTARQGCQFPCAGALPGTLLRLLRGRC